MVVGRADGGDEQALGVDEEGRVDGAEAAKRALEALLAVGQWGVFDAVETVGARGEGLSFHTRSIGELGGLANFSHLAAQALGGSSLPSLRMRR